MQKIKKLLIAIYYIVVLTIVFIIGNILKLLKKEYRNIWLVSERGIDARDNAFVFYQYLKREHPEINSYYIISKKMPDYKKVKQYGNVIEYKSLKHILYLAIAKYKISTHDQGCSPNMVIFHWIHKLPLYFYGKQIFLQHGIIKDDIPWYHRNECKPDLFVTSTQDEYNFVKKKFHQPTPQLQLLGLCRYDNLVQKHLPQKQILLMPTWRKGFDTKEQFLKSEYFKTYQNLLQNQKLLKYLKENDYTLIFYPHIEFQKYLNCFKKSENIILADLKHYDVQKLLIESEILITDYSSVFFDFAYLEKPIYFYQFDQQSFYKNHYNKGYFDFHKIGIVSTTENELVSNILKSNETDIIKKYKKNLYKYRDTNNCERTYQRILNL